MSKNNGDQLQQVVQGIEELLAQGMDIASITVRLIEEAGYSTRKIMENLGGLNLIKKNFFPNVEKDLKSHTKLKRATTYVSSLEKKLGEGLVNADSLADAIASIPKINITPYKASKKQPIRRILNLVLSDLHIGSDLKAEETGHLDFGKVEESRRLARIIQETIDYKPQYRAETKLNVLLLGDLIQGDLGHDKRDGAPVTEQVARAIHLLSQGIAQLAKNFQSVEIIHESGNHSRYVNRHPGRAIKQKWDSFETVIAYALKNIFKNVPNVKFIIPLSPYVSVPLFNSRMFLTHGDGVLKVGYPGSSIKTGHLEAQVNKINASLPDSQEYSVFVVGHVHVASMTHMSNGAVLITNGAMVPIDDFAVSIGLMESVCGQYLFESVDGYPVGDCRLIKLSKVDDLNVSLDKIIDPFSGF